MGGIRRLARVKAEGVEVLQEKVFDATRHTPRAKAP
jgi:hypothetical protein